MLNIINKKLLQPDISETFYHILYVTPRVTFVNKLSMVQQGQHPETARGNHYLIKILAR